MISSGRGRIHHPRCSGLGSGIAGIELVCGAECSPDQAVQLHKPMLFLAGGEVSATSAAASSSGKRGIVKKEKKGSVINSKISSVWILPKTVCLQDVSSEGQAQIASLLDFLHHCGFSCADAIIPHWQFLWT